MAPMFTVPLNLPLYPCARATPFVDLAQAALDVFGKSATERRELHATPFPLEQGSPQFGLERFNSVRKRRLGDVKLFGSVRVMLHLGQLGEVIQLRKVHARSVRRPTALPSKSHTKTHLPVVGPVSMIQENPLAVLYHRKKRSRLLTGGIEALESRYCKNRYSVH